MDFKRLVPGLCWFGATCLAVVAFGLALMSIVIRAGHLWTPEGLGLVILAGTALVFMAVLMVIAFRLERDEDRRPQDSDGPATFQ